MTAVPNVKVIQYIRGNIIKSAISSHRGMQTHQTCGASNFKQDSMPYLTYEMKNGDKNVSNSIRNKVSKCRIPDTVNWTVSEFVEHVSNWQVLAPNE